MFCFVPSQLWCVLEGSPGLVGIPCNALILLPHSLPQPNQHPPCTLAAPYNVHDTVEVEVRWWPLALSLLCQPDTTTDFQMYRLLCINLACREPGLSSGSVNLLGTQEFLAPSVCHRWIQGWYIVRQAISRVRIGSRWTLRKMHIINAYRPESSFFSMRGWKWPWIYKVGWLLLCICKLCRLWILILV